MEDKQTNNKKLSAEELELLEDFRVAAKDQKTSITDIDPPLNKDQIRLFLRSLDVAGCFGIDEWGATCELKGGSNLYNRSWTELKNLCMQGYLRKVPTASRKALFCVNTVRVQL